MSWSAAKQATLLLLMLVLPASEASFQAKSPDLARGVRQVQDGEFEDALLTLDLVARRLASEPGRSRELAQAYLYMGAAYVGLGQEALARARFQQGLRQDKELRPSADEFPAKVLRAFEAARADLAESAALEKEARKKRGKGGLILLGLGGAAATGIAVAVTVKERPNRPPSASMSITPEGQAITNVTRMTLTATASDLDGEPLSYTWDLGDGRTATGSTVTHIYTREGTFTVALTVGDGLTTTRVTGTVAARSMSGSWRVAGQAFLGVMEFRINDFGNGGFSATVLVAGGESLRFESGSLTDPRNVTMAYLDCRNNSCNCTRKPCLCSFRFTGQADPALRNITGTLTCQNQNLRCAACAGQAQPLTLVRP